MCYDNECILSAEHEGCHTDGSGAWIDGGKSSIKTRVNKIRQATPRLTECIGYTVQAKDKVVDKLTFEVKVVRAKRDLHVERKLAKK